MRQVGKRTLESLIKVGAMRAFGKRQQLLDAMDRIISFSSNHHKDQEIGQMNLFGDVVRDNGITLPKVDEVSDRIMLDWEKELLGLYVTGRPADKYRQDLLHANTTEISMLKENGAMSVGALEGARKGLRAVLA